MNSRRLTFAGAIVVSLVVASAAVAPSPPKQQQSGVPPNIILFIADDLGWQDVALPFANHETELNRRYRTPNLIGMAAEGMKFTNSYSAGPVCSPTRVALITGRTPAQTHVTAALGHRDQDPVSTWPGLLSPPWNINGLSPVAGTPQTFTAPLLPRLLHDAGYRTIHVGKGHWGAHGAPGADPLALGFDLNIGGSGAGNPSSYLGEANFSAGSRASSEAHDYDVPGLEAYHGTNTFLTEALTIEANKAIDQAVADGKPFFLHFAQFAPHTPLNPDVRFLSNYMNAGLPAAEVVYASLIEGLDKSLGDVLANIERHGLSESTFFVFMSDNGASVEGRNRQENEYNAPLRSHKRSAFEGALRVPLVIKWAGHIKPNTTNATPVITDDLFPTILSLARVPDAERYTAGIRGRDMSTMLTGQGNVDPERVLLWHFPHATVARIGQPGEPFSAIRQGQWKLIFHYGSRRYELYNLSTDLSETHDVVAENGAVVARLSRLLRDALSKEGAQLPVDAGTKRQVDLPPLVGG